MNRVPVCVAAAAVLMLTGGAIAIAGKPAAPERVMIVPDQQAGAVRFVIDGTEQARLDATGLHVRAGISYGGALTNYGAAGFDAHGAESVGGGHAR